MPCGYEAPKKVNGRKRFGASDGMENLLESTVLPADTAERAGAWPLLERLKASSSGQCVALVCADEDFAGADWEDRVRTRLSWPVEIVPKPKVSGRFHRVAPPLDD